MFTFYQHLSPIVLNITHCSFQAGCSFNTTLPEHATGLVLACVYMNRPLSVSSVKTDMSLFCKDDISV